MRQTQVLRMDCGDISYLKVFFQTMRALAGLCASCAAQQAQRARSGSDAGGALGHPGLCSRGMLDSLRYVCACAGDTASFLEQQALCSLAGGDVAAAVGHLSFLQQECVQQSQVCVCMRRRPGWLFGAAGAVLPGRRECGGSDTPPGALQGGPAAGVQSIWLHSRAVLPAGRCHRHSGETTCMHLEYAV